MSELLIPAFEKIAALQARFPVVVGALSQLARNPASYRTELTLIEMYLMTKAAKDRLLRLAQVKAIPVQSDLNLLAQYLQAISQTASHPALSLINDYAKALELFPLNLPISLGPTAPNTQIVDAFSKPLPAPALQSEASQQVLAKADGSTFISEMLLREPRLSTLVSDDVARLCRLADARPATDPKVIIETRDFALMRVMLVLIESPALPQEKDPRARWRSDLHRNDQTRLATIVALSNDLPPVLGRVAQLDEWEKGLDWAAQMKMVEDEVEAQLISSGAPSTSDQARASIEQHADAVALLKIVTGLSEEQQRAFIAEPRLSKMLRGEIVDFLAAGTTAPDNRLDVIDQIEKSWDLRLEIGQHVLNLRRFAKQEALVRRWPGLTKTIYESGGRIIRELERLATGTLETPPSEVQKVWEAYKTDESLLALLRLRPLFNESTEKPIVSEHAYREATSAMASVAPSTVEIKANAEATPEPLAMKLEVSPAIELFVTISSGDAGYKSAVKAGSEEVQGDVDLKLELIDKQIEELRKKISDSSYTGSSVYPALQELGTRLFDGLVNQDNSKIILDALDSSKLSAARQNIRVNMDIQPRALSRLPWECLYFPVLRDHWGLLPNTSIVRYLPSDSSSAKPVRALQRARVFVFFGANPKSGTAALEQDNLRRILESSAQFDLRMLISPDITPETILRTATDYSPDILHFSGQTSTENTGSPAVLLYSQGSIVKWPISYLVDLASSHSIRIVVFHALLEAGLEDVVKAFLAAGVQAVITVTSRPDPRATYLFAREFYRALAEGRNVERSLVDARRGLQAEGRDWTSYALFTSLPDISALRVEQPATK